MRALGGLIDWLVLAALIVLALLWMAPVLWIVGLSLKPNDLLAQNLSALPPFTLRNYADAVTQMPLLRWMLNSTVVAVCQTLLTLVVASLAGYGFARTNFPGKRALIQDAGWGWGASM